MNSRFYLLLAAGAVYLLAPACASRPPRPSEIGTPLHRHYLGLEDRRLWREELRWPDSCEEGQSFDSAMVDFFDWGVKTTLVQVTCRMGAYQGVYRYYLYDESFHPPAVTPLAFAGADGRNEEELIGSPEVIPAAREIRLVVKGRGVGDCGTYLDYVFHEDRPELHELRGKKNCDGRGLDPQVWTSVPLPAK